MDKWRWLILIGIICIGIILHQIFKRMNIRKRTESIVEIVFGIFIITIHVVAICLDLEFSDNSIVFVAIGILMCTHALYQLRKLRKTETE